MRLDSEYAFGMSVLRSILLTLCVLVAVPTAAQNLSDQGAAAQAMVNDLRKGKSRQPLTVSAKLTRAAEAHTRDMVKNGFFSHSGSDGSSVGDRVRRQGYGFCFVAENISKGRKSVEDVLAAWMASKGHRRNILHKQAREFALVRGSGDVWVMVLGRPGC